MSKSKCDWVRMGRNGQWTCGRCGDKYLFLLPAPVDVFIAAAKAYGKIHGRCRPDGSQSAQTFAAIQRINLVLES